MENSENGKFIGSVKVGPKGQIVIPKEVREIFGIAPGDTLILLADINRGIAIERQGVLNSITDAIFAGEARKLNRADAAALKKTTKPALEDDGNE